MNLLRQHLGRGTAQGNFQAFTLHGPTTIALPSGDSLDLVKEKVLFPRRQIGVQFPKDLFDQIEIFQFETFQTIVFEVQVQGLPGVFTKKIEQQKGLAAPADTVKYDYLLSRIKFSVGAKILS
jgi:hypothetical protein